MKFLEIAKWTIAFVQTPEGQVALHLSEELLAYLWAHRPTDVSQLPGLVHQFKQSRNLPV